MTSTLEHTLSCHLCNEKLTPQDISLRLVCGHLYHYICFQFTRVSACIVCNQPVQIPEYPNQFILHNINLKWLEHKAVRKFLLHEILKREPPKFKPLPDMVPLAMSEDEIEMDHGFI